MFKELLVSIATQFHQHKIPYIIIGGQAVLLYGEPRLTKDIDVTIGLNIDALDKIVNILKDIPLTPLPKDIRQFVRKTMVLPMVQPKNSLRVDIIFSFSTYEQEAITRANPVLLNGTPVKFVSLEDLIVFKIFSGRPRDNEDVRSILLKNPLADIEFIKTQLANLSFEEKDFLKDFNVIWDSLNI